MKHHSKHRQYKLLLAAGAALASALPTAYALTYNWTGAATPDTSFQTSGNWDQTWNEWGDYVFGSVATTGTATINGSFGIHSLSLDSGLGYDIAISGSQPMIMHTGSTITIDTASTNLTIGNAYQANGSVSWNIGAGRTFTLNGVCQNWAGQGTISIVKQGDGTALLANTANTYSGVTVLEGGVLNAASFSDYGSNGSLGNRASDASGNVGILFRGGTLQYTGSTAQSTNRGIRINANGGGGKSGGATIDASGSNPSATLSFTATSSPDFFEYGGDRTLTLIGSNTGANTFAMAIAQNGGTTSVVKNGTGKWVLSGNSSYGGTTDITKGTLVAASSTALGTGGFSSGNMTNIRDGATLALQGGISVNEHFHVWGAGVDGLGAVRSLAGNNALTTTNGSGGAGYALRSNTTVGVDADTLTISGFYQDGGTFGITKVGAGTLKFSAGSSYGGQTDIKEGTLVAANSTALGTGGLSSTTMTYIRDGATLALQGGVSLDEHFHAWGNGVGGLGTVRSLSGNNALTLKDGLNHGGLGIDTDITVGVDADKLTASGFYHDSGSFGITKVGNGTLELSAKSRYTGATTVAAGVLAISSTGSLNASSVIGVTGGELNYNSTSDAGNVNLTATGATLSGAGTGRLGNVTYSAASGTTYFEPGNSIGTLKVSNLALNGTTTSIFEINPLLSTADLVDATGTVTYDGILNVIYGGSASDFTNGMIFNLFDAVTFSGSFDSLSLPTLTGGLSWQDNLSTNGTLAVIPEPSAAALGLLAAGSLLLRRRRA